jgi:hypothetical protein
MRDFYVKSRGEKKPDLTLKHDLIYLLKKQYKYHFFEDFRKAKICIAKYFRKTFKKILLTVIHLFLQIRTEVKSYKTIKIPVTAVAGNIDRKRH